MKTAWVVKILNSRQDKFLKRIGELEKIIVSVDLLIYNFITIIYRYPLNKSKINRSLADLS